VSAVPSAVARTFLDALVEAIERASTYNKQDQTPPVAILWPDKERQWETLLARLGERLPLFTLGPYAPEQRRGPAYWLRCIIARTVQQSALAADQVPVLYLSGYSRQDVRAREDCPRELQPLAELQYRGVLWAQRNGRDWTVAAFLQSKDGGLGIDVAADTATREGLTRSLAKLADESVERLHREAPLRAPFLDGLLHPDEVKNILRWLNDPKGVRSESSLEEWEAFVALCRSRYDFDPEKDGPIAAARLLGQRGGAWEKVWRRFAEAPASYTALPQVLRQARPSKLLPLLDPRDAWPQENEAAEEALRQSLLSLSNLDPQTARAALAELEEEHGPRRGWVWASLAQAPLARALEHLVMLARETERLLGGASIGEIAAAYAEHGWRADLAVLDALAAVEAAQDLGAVRAAVRTVYRPWLEAGAVSFQKAVATGRAGEAYSATAPPAASAGTCVLFSDGLRYDAAERLASRLAERGLECTVSAGFGALPGVTDTAKPAVSPAADAFTGGASAGLEPVLAASGTKVTIEVLRRALMDKGVQVLKGDDLGDPGRAGWTELGDLDNYGHEHGWRVAHHLDHELRDLVRRVETLLAHGWQRVVVVTDHGWLLLPGGLPKADLPEHLTEVRKGRCARLKEGSQTEQQVVPWHWDPSVRFAVAPGIHCYEAGKEYDHGGLSPQECVVPILSVSRTAAKEPVAVDSVTWRRLRCNVMVKGATPGLRVDLRTKPGDPGTSIAGGGKDLAADGTATLLVEDEDREGEAAVVVVVDVEGELRAQLPTMVGG
jgi:hypothetical protein